MLKVSKRGQQVISSPIRKFLPYMRLAEERGLNIYKLNTGDPDLAVPAEFFKTLRAYKQRNLNYAPSPGYPEHVAAWQKYYREFGVKLAPQNIIPTVGCAEAIMLALMAVADVGDEIIVFEPLYVSYKSFAVMLGIKLVPITLTTKNNFALPKASEIAAKITSKTRAIVIINPDNPTGKLWSGGELDLISTLAVKHNIFLIADETYREIRFTGEPYCMLSDKKARENLILVDSVSKRYSMPGARVGCLVSYNAELMATVLKFAQARLSVGTLEQFALIPILKNSQRYTKPAAKEYARRLDIVYQGLKSMPGVECGRPGGAFYIFAKLPIDSAEEFVKFLLKDFEYKGETVMISPMQDFYITPGLGKDEIRIAYVLNVKALKKAMEVLKQGLLAYQAKSK